MPDPNLCDQRDWAAINVDNALSALHTAQDVLAGKLVTPPVTASSLNGQTVKLQCVDNSGRLLDFDTGLTRLLLRQIQRTRELNGTSRIWEMGEISLYSPTAAWHNLNSSKIYLDGQVNDDQDGVQLNAFGDGTSGTTWQLTMGSDGIAKLQCVNGEYVYLDGRTTKGTPGLAKFISDPGTTWKISMSDQPVQGSAGTPTPMDLSDVLFKDFSNCDDKATYDFISAQRAKQGLRIVSIISDGRLGLRQ